MTTISTCILFDIDGTLIHTHGAGRDAFAQALCETLDVEDDLASISFAGATDLNLFHLLCKKHNRQISPEKEATFFRLLEQYLNETLSGKNIILFPGVIELLDVLSCEQDILLGLLTGNAENCARVKLAPHSLNTYFSFGGFGNEYALRADIAHKAHKRAILRAGHRGLSFFVIGDTPQDVLAARAIHAKCLAVATGKYSEAALAEAGADYVFSTLSDTASIHRILRETGR